MPLMNTQAGGHIFVSSTQPSSSTLVTGDIWVDTSLSPGIIIPKVWNGSSMIGFLSAQTNIIIAGITDTLEHFITSIM